MEGMDPNVRLQVTVIVESATAGFVEVDQMVRHAQIKTIATSRAITATPAPSNAQPNQRMVKDAHGILA